ncbi:MAG: aminotransferase class III-fold pyridoxal phosphate-dependent enzyme, partial [Okeania sp. SIO4D6]|nr:aminotransferase class III-fold pyridoxal phosphate-dependent enzyme [Okeania sp. SIO4D6]
ITGFGRTGRWFATETYDLRPMLITLAKQLSAAYFPISAVAVHDDQQL